jgi:hypothetical protein
MDINRLEQGDLLEEKEIQEERERRREYRREVKLAIFALLIGLLGISAIILAILLSP